MKLFECCWNCKHSGMHYGSVYCEYNSVCRYIEFPHFMGGSHCCECYEKWHRPKKEKFQYPKKKTEKETKVEKNVKNILGLNITGATLLTDKEAEQLPQRLREYKKYWWLKSPGYSSLRSAFVIDPGFIDDWGICVSDSIVVRPVLIISNLESSNLKIGDTFKFGDREFEIISTDKAFCLGDIGTSIFRNDWKASDANVYEKSDVKKFIDNWFKKVKEIKNG